ncbi:hypothetical protein [Streptomyces sp. NBC_00525]|uniref:pPIWI_RE_Z domain-containing protein n=1 Tax=Streptomyces sp. NBC_00525 TaxID=2903660 RepID=UPI002E81BD39|nr:hypothetical protein [Streptomyces sp. NBC_00525]WUC96415.1 hypothetical protein OG710_23670 [Streptomyces sp. NBC_00525]
MRDRSGWYQQLVKDMRPWPAEHRSIKPALLCQVELGLRLLETLAPGRDAAGIWVLLGGYPFASTAGLATTPQDQLTLTAARHLLWPMRRRRLWQQSLENYRQLPEQLRGYRVPVDGGPARRVLHPTAAHRFDVYDRALGRIPDFATNPLPHAGEGAHRFKDQRRYSSVTIPPEFVLDPAPGHDLVAHRPLRHDPIEVPLAELDDIAAWMDAREREFGRSPGQWRERLSRLELDVRTAEGTDFAPAKTLSLDGLTHLVGMVGAGKSTLMILLAVWAHQRNLRTTLVVGDVAEQLGLTQLFQGLKLRAALVQGSTTRPKHTQRLHRRLASRGERSLLDHTDQTFAHLSTACPLDALRVLEAVEPLRFADAPCGDLYPVDRGTVESDEHGDAEPRVARVTRELQRARGARPETGRPGSATSSEAAGTEETDDPGNRHACPLWSACPRQSSSRDLVEALIWVANPASLVHTAVPRQLNAERLRYLELACLRSDIVIVDEADRVQMQLDQVFAPTATLVTTGPESWLDRLQTHAIAELSRRGRLQLSDQDVERWSSALDVVGSATDRLYAMLISTPTLRKWAQIDYFSPWTLQERLLNAWYPPASQTTEGDDTTDEAEFYDDEEALHVPPGVAPAPLNTPWAAERDRLTRAFDVFRDDPLGDRGPHGTLADDLARTAHDVLHTLQEKRTRGRVRALLNVLLAGAPKPCERPPLPGETPWKEDAFSEEWLELNAERLEFTLILAALHQRLDRVTFLWPQVEAALRLDHGEHELTRRPPLDYAPLLPASPMGNVLGFQFLLDERDSHEGRRTGTLRFFRCAGVGRELLLALPQLGADPARGTSGPTVLLMSGTSWAGTSTRAHVVAPVRAVLKPQPEALSSIGETVFRTEFMYDDAGQPIRISGQSPENRDDVLRLLVEKLARSHRDHTPSPLHRELAQIPDQRRRRALLLVGSYREAAVVAAALSEMSAWRDRVRVLAADDALLEASLAAEAELEGSATVSAVRRGDLAAFAEDTRAQILVAPLLAVERGHNILTVPRKPGEGRVAAFGTVLFLVRPHPRPDDLFLSVFAVNDWVTRFIRNHPGLSEGTFAELVGEMADLDGAGSAFRTAARGVWRRLLSRSYVYSRLSDAEQESFAWDQLVTLWQVIGRLVRGGVPARVVFVDAAFAPRLAAGGRAEEDRPPRWLRDPGLLVRLRDVLAPYFAPGPVACADPADASLVRLLYRPLYDALCGIENLPSGGRRSAR